MSEEKSQVFNVLSHILGVPNIDTWKYCDIMISGHMLPPFEHNNA